MPRAIEMSMAAMILKGIRRKNVLKRNKLIRAVAIAVIKAAEVLVAHDFIFSAVLTKTAVVGAIHISHHKILVIPNHHTSWSLSNGSLVMFVAIFAETIVSTTAIIAITAAVLNTPGNIAIRCVHVVERRWVGKWNKENWRFGYLACKRTRLSRHI